MRYVLARYKDQQRELAYRIYASEALRAMTENTAKFGGGAYIKGHYADILSGSPGERAPDPRTHEEIVSHVFGKLRAVREDCAPVTISGIPAERGNFREGGEEV